jgi:type IV secretory pathway VirD2 relaxase
VEDGRAFLERGDDRHQFRFIVSAEDGAELADLRTTTRDLTQLAQNRGSALGKSKA